MKKKLPDKPIDVFKIIRRRKIERFLVAVLGLFFLCGSSLVLYSKFAGSRADAPAPNSGQTRLDGANPADSALQSSPNALAAKDPSGTFRKQAGEEEIVSERTESFKKFKKIENGVETYRIAGQIGAIHYKTDPFSVTEQYKEIDLTLQTNTDKKDKDYDYYLDQNGYQLNIWNQQKIKGNNLSYVAKFIRAGESISMAPLVLAWENSAGEYQEIAKPVPGIKPEIDNNNYTITWKDAFGAGIDFRYNNSADKFFKTVIVNDKSNLPVATIGADGLKLTIVMSTAWSNVEAGNSFAKVNKNKDLATEYQMAASKDESKKDPEVFSYKDDKSRDLWWVQKPLAWDSSTDEHFFNMNMTMEKAGDNSYMKLSTASSDIYSPTTTFPLVMDTALTTKQVSASTDDAVTTGTTWPGTTTTTLNDTTFRIGTYAGTYYLAGFRFSGITIPKGSTINSASLQVCSDLSLSNAPSWTIAADNADNPATYSSGRTPYTVYSNKTSASVSWAPSAWTAGSFYASPDISTVVQEIVNRSGWSSGNAVAPIAYAVNSSQSINRTIRTWDYTGNASGAKFDATYTAPVTVPDAPTIGTATAGNGSASVSFTPPANDGGSAITGYTVTSTPGGFTGIGSSSPITVSGLTNGTAYTFTVHATNSKGNSLESAASNSVTPNILLTGTVYSDLAQTLGIGSNRTISVIINGGSTKYSGETDASGNYSIPAPIATGDVVTLFIDNETEKGSMVFKFGTVSGDQTGIFFVAGYTKLHHSGTEITNAIITTGYNSSYSDILFTPSGSNVTYAKGLLIRSTKTYRPGGNVSCGNVYNVGTLNLEGNTLTVSGSYTNSGTFTGSGSSTVIFNSANSNETITSGGSSFDQVTFNNASGVWTISDAMVLNGDLTITAGTLAGASNVTVKGGDVTGNGTINMSGGTFLVDGTGNFGGATDWSFSALTFGDGSGTTTTTKTGTNIIAASGNLTIATNQTLDAGTTYWRLSADGTPFVISGTFTQNASTIVYSGTTVNITATTYYNLNYNKSGGTASLIGSTTVGHIMNIINGAVNASSQILILSGSGTPFVISGTFTPSASTVRYTGTAATTITAATYNILELKSGSGSPTYTLAGGTINVNNNFINGDGANAVTTNADTNDPVLNIDGNFTNAAAATFIASATASFSVASNYSNSATAVFTHSSGIVTFDGQGAQSITAAGDPFYNIRVSNTAAEVSQADAVTIAAALLINANAIFDINGQSITLTTLTNNGTFRLQGGETATITSKDTSAGTVEYDGAGTYASLSYGNAYYSLKISGAGSFSIGASTTAAGNVTVSSGTLALGDNGYTLAITGTVSISGGTLSIPDQSGYRTKLTANSFSLSSGTFYNGNLNSTDINGTFTVTGGTITQRYALYISGDFSFSNATLSNTISSNIYFDGSTNSALNSAPASFTAFRVAKGAAYTLTLNASITAASFIVDSGLINTNGKTITLNTDNGYLTGAGATLDNVVIAANVIMNSTVTINGTFTVNADKMASFVGNGNSTMFSNTGRLILSNSNSAISSGGSTSYFLFKDDSATNLPATGNMIGVLKFEAATKDIIIPARSYLGRVEVINSGSSNRVATFGTASSQTIAIGNQPGDATFGSGLFVAAQGTGNMTINASTYNPNVIIDTYVNTVNGDLDFTGTGGGSEIILAGSGTWSVKGDIDFTGGTFTKGTSTVLLTGTGANQTQTITSASQQFNNFAVQNNATGGVIFADSATVTGTFTDITASSKLTFHALATYAFANININGQASGTKITMASSDPANGTPANRQWYFNITQANPQATFVTVTDSDALGGSMITVITSTNGGNNENWNFGITISGTVYTAENKLTNIGAAKTIALSINGAAATTHETAAGGVFSFTDIPVAADNTVALYISGETEKGSFITRALDATTSITGIELFTSHIVLSHETTGESTGYISNDFLATADNVADSDLLVSVGAYSAATFTAGNTVWVIAGKTYIPVGNVTAGKINVAGSFRPGGYVDTFTDSGDPFIVSGTVTESTTTVIYTGSGSTNLANLRYYNLALAPSSGSATYSLTGHQTTTKSISGNLTISANATLDTTANNYNIDLGGNWLNNGIFTKRASTVTLNGSAAQTLTCNGTDSAHDFYNLTVTNASTAGVAFADSATVTGTFTDATASSTVAFHSGSTYAFNAININGQSTSTRVTLISSTGGSAWNLNITASSPTASYVSVKDSTANKDIDATTGGQDLTGNTHWLFTIAPPSGITISGTVYTAEDKGTNIGVNKTVALSINGAAATTAETTSGGAFSFANVTVAADNTVALYLSGETENASLITQAADNGSNITGLELYTGNIMLSHQSAGPMTNALLATADNVADSDLLVSVDGSNTATFTATAWVPTGKTYIPNAAVVATSFNIDGTFNPGSNNLTILGSWDSNNGVVTTSGTATFAGASGTISIGSGGQSFNNLVLNDGGGSATFRITTALDVNGTFTLTHGTLDLDTNDPTVNIAGNISITGGSITKSSSDALVTFDGDQNYSNSAGSNFGDIRIGRSPDTTTLSSDLACDSLTIASGDSLITNGYNITCAGDITINGSATLNATTAGGRNSTISVGGNWSNSGTLTASTSSVTMTNTSGTKTVTSGGQSFNNFTMDGVGGTTEYLDAFSTSAAGTLTLTNGTLNTNNQAVNIGIFDSNNSNIRTLTLGSSQITLASASASTAWVINTSSLTFNANTSAITFNATNGTFSTGGLTYHNVTFSSVTGTLIISGSNAVFASLSVTGSAAKTNILQINDSFSVTGTFSLAGNSAINRLLTTSDALGAARTLTVSGATLSINNIDLRDITFARSDSGALDLTNGGMNSVGDCGGNSKTLGDSTSLTFTTATTQTWNKASGSNAWSDAANWTSRVPLPQDNVSFALAFNSGAVVYADMPRLGKSIDWSGASWSGTAVNCYRSVNSTIYGSLTMKSGMTFTNDSETYFEGRGSYTLTSAGTSFAFLNIQMVGGTLTLQDALTVSYDLTVIIGTLDNSGGYAVSARTLYFSGSSARSIVMGSATWTLTNINGTSLDASGSNRTLTSTGSTIALTGSGSGGTCDFIGGGLIYNDIIISGAGTTAPAIDDSNTFHNFTIATPKTVKFQSSTTQTITGSFNAVGTSGNLVTISSNTSGSPATLSKASGLVFIDYASIQDITATGGATWYVGANVTQVSGDSGFTAAKVWDGGGGATTSWSTATNWTGDVVPTSSDDVFFSGATTNATIDASFTNSIKSLNLVSTYINTITAGKDLTVLNDVNIAAGTLSPVSYTLSLGGSWTLTGGTFTYGTSNVKMTNTSGTKTVTSGGQSFYNFTMDGVGGTTQFLDAFNTPPTGTLYLTNGTLNTNNQAVTTGYLNSSNTNTRTLTLGSSVLTITKASAGAFQFNTAAGATINANTSSVIFSGANGRLQCPGKTFNNVTFTGGGAMILYNGTFANITVTGTAAKTDNIQFVNYNGATNTISGTLALNGNSSINRLLVQSGTPGIQQTLSSASNSISNADFMDIKGAGAASWDLSAITGLSGDCGGNSNITFTTAAPQTWTNAAGGTWSTVSNWTSRVPLPQDDVSMNIGSNYNSGVTVTADMPRLGKSIDWTGVTYTGTKPTWVEESYGLANTNYGNLTLISDMTLSNCVSSCGSYTVAGRSSHTITTGGKTLRDFSVKAPGGTYALADSFRITYIFRPLYGTFRSAGQSITLDYYLDSYNNSPGVRAIDISDSTVTVGYTWTIGDSNLTFTSTNSTLIMSSNSSGQLQTMGSKTYNNIQIVPGTNYIQFSGSFTFNNMTMSAAGAKTVKFTKSTTYTMTGTNFLSGTNGNVVTIDSDDSATAFTLSKTSGTVSSYYLSLKNSAATGGATWNAYNSTNVANNTGWNFLTGGITISGTVYTAEDKGTNIGANKTVALSINGAAATTAETTSGGAFSFANVTVAADNTVALYLSGETENASLITQAADGTTNIIGLELFASHIVLTNATSNPMTNTLLATADNVSDNDFLVSVDVSNNATFTSGNTVWIISGKTYTPGANVNAGSLNVAGTFTPETNTVTLADSGTPFINSGTFNEGTSTIIYTGSSATNVAGTTYNNLTVNHTGTTFTATGNITVKAAWTIQAGAFDASDKAISLAGTGTPFVNSGTFTPSTSTLYYTGAGSTTITAAAYNNLYLSPSSQVNAVGSDIWILAGAGTESANGTYHLVSDKTYENASGDQIYWNYDLSLWVVWDPIWSDLYYSDDASLPCTFDAIANGKAPLPSMDYNQVDAIYTFAAGTTNVNGDFTNVGAEADAQSNNPTLNIDGDFLNNGGAIFRSPDSAAFSVASDYTNSGEFYASGGTLALDGQGLQTIATGASEIDTARYPFSNLTVTNASTAGVHFAGSVSVNNIFTDTTASSKLTFHAGSTYAFANININGQASGTKITMVSSDPANADLPSRQWYFNVPQTSPQASYVDVTDSDAKGGNAITPINSTDGGNNENWLFGITISGTVYTAENKGANIGAGKTVALSINGAAATTVETTSGGIFSFSSITIATNNTVALFIDGETEKGSLVTQAADSTTNISGLELYTSHIVLTHNTAGPMTNTLLATADNVADSDLLASVSGSDATFTPGNTVWILGGKTYAPSGNVLAGSINILPTGTFSPEGNTVTLADSGTPLTVGGTFNEGASTVIYTGSSATNITGTTYNNLKLDSGVYYYKSVSITNGSGGVLTDYQVKLELSSSNFDFSKSSNDGRDIRFYDSNNTTAISFYISSWDQVGQTAVIWAKVPTIPTSGTTIYMHFGNLNLTSASSGDNTFLFFDDFSGTSLNTTKWPTHVGETVGSGNLTLNLGTDNVGTEDYVWATNYAIPIGSAVEMRTKAAATTSRMRFGMSDARTTFYSSSLNYIGIQLYTDDTLYTDINAGGTLTQSSITSYDANWHNYKYTWVSGAANLYRDTSLLKTYTTNVPTSAALMHPYIRDDGQVDWIFVRKLAATEPVASVGSVSTGQTAAGDITVKSVFTVSSGVFDASNKTISLTGSGTPFVNSGTFTASTGTVKYQGTSATTITAATYYNLEMSPSSGSPTYTMASGTINTNNLTIGNGSQAVTTTADANDPTLNIDGSFQIKANATFIASATAAFSLASNFTNSATGTFTDSAGTLTLDGQGAQTITAAGTDAAHDFHNLTVINASVAGVSFADSATVTGTFTDVTASSKLTFHALSTYAFAAINVNGQASGTQITMVSSDPANGTVANRQWYLNVSSASPQATYVNVTDSDANGGNLITASYSTNGGNTENWDFGITVSGTVYTVENRSSNIGAGKTVAISINGGASATIETTSGGAFSTNVAGVTAGKMISVFLDGEVEKASLVTQAADGITNITGLELFTGHIVLTHNTAGPITNALLATADNVSDSDLLISVSGSNATFTAGNKIWIPAGKTYTPGGNVTCGSMDILSAGTFNPEANTVIFTDAGTPFAVYGTFNEASSTVVYASANATNVTGATYNNLTLGYQNAHSRKITVSNSSGGALTDYQIKISLTSSNFDFINSTNDGRDVRIFNSDAVTPLNFYIESWNQSEQSATIWAKIPSLATGDSNIYLNYGDSSLTSASSGPNTFAGFDDFGDGSIGSQWTTTTGNGSITESGGKLNFSYTGSQNNDWWTSRPEKVLKLNSLPAGDFQAEILLNNYTITDLTEAGMAVYGSDTSAYLWGRVKSGTYDKLDLTKAGGVTVGAYESTVLPMRLAVRKIGASYSFWLSPDGVTWTQTGSTYSDVAFNNVVLFGKEWSSNDLNFSMDNFIVRKIVAAEPTTTVGPVETYLAAGDITVKSVLTVSSGVFDASSRSITLAGTGTPFVNNGTFTPSTSTVRYTGAGDTNITAGTYNNLETSPSAESGASSGWVVDKAGNGTYNGTYTANGTYSGETAYTNGSTWLFYYNSAWWLDTSKHTSPPFAYSGSSTLPGSWTVGMGTSPKPELTAAPATITYTFASGTVNINGNYVNGDGTHAVNTTADTNDPTINIDGNYSNSASATFTASASAAFSVASNFTNSTTGKFTDSNATLTLDGQNLQTITANGTDADHDFHNLTVTNASTAGVSFVDSATVAGTFTDVTASSKLTFHALSTYAFAAININGQASGTKITMASSDPANGTPANRQWYLKVSGASPQATFVNVTDSDANGGNAITPITSTDGGNNENWLFNTAPNSPSSLSQKKVTGGTALVTGDWANENQVTFSATASDPDSSDTLYLCVEKDPIATAFSGTNGGDLCGVGVVYSGTPVPVSVTITGLADATSFHWQAQVKDAASAYSSFVSYGSNTENPPTSPADCDFGVDTTAPTSGTVYDGLSGDQDWNNGALNTISANWLGFDASASGLKKYEYAIRRTSDGWYWNAADTIWQSGAVWANNSTATAATVAPIYLNTGELYYFSVKATDNAGNVADPVSSNGQQVSPTLSMQFDSSVVSFSNLGVANSWTDTKSSQLKTSTNAANGYTIQGYISQLLTSLAYPSATIPNFNYNSASWSSPQTWPSGQYGFGYTSDDALVAGSNRFSGGTKYAPFQLTSPGDIVADHTTSVNGQTGAISDETFNVSYKVAVSPFQGSTDYRTYVTYIVTANF